MSIFTSATRTTNTGTKRLTRPGCDSLYGAEIRLALKVGGLHTGESAAPL